MQSFLTKSHLENNKKIHTIQHNKKKKSYLCLNEKLEFASYKGDD